jgi:hypothetical protein
MNKNILEKYDIDEPIQVGDLISYEPETDKVTRARVKHWKEASINKVIGVCTAVNDNMITYTNQGLVDVRVKGLICIGDRLTASDEFGIAVAIKYDQDETKFRIRHLGKVVELYNDYSIAKVLLDIE